jgi:hypothetical protein
VKHIAILLIVCSAVGWASMAVKAQDNLEDVVYLKNGNVYRGLIIEQIPGESIKIKTIGGNVFTVMIADIQKLTKEEKLFPENIAPYNNTKKLPPIPADSVREMQKKSWERRRGYLLQANMILDFFQFGLRVVNGYKINRYAQIGIGLGADNVLTAPQLIFNNDVLTFSAIYFPVYFYFGGEILKYRFTPYYGAEVGYAGTLNNVFSNFSSNNELRGGAMGSVGFGGEYMREEMSTSLLYST